MRNHGSGLQFSVGLLVGLAVCFALLWYDDANDRYYEANPAPVYKPLPDDVELVCEWRWPDGRVYQKL